jgi:hypothetical protein
MTRNKIHLIVLAATLITLSCKKDDNTLPNTSDLGLPEKAVNQLDTVPGNSLDLKNFKTSDGHGIKSILELYDPTFLNSIGGRSAVVQSELTGEEQKDLLVSKLIGSAYYFTSRMFFTYPNEGPSNPAQNGLAYVFGSRSINQRTRSTGSCTENLHGLDCSGLIYNLFRMSGVSLTLPTSVQTFSNVSYLNNALSNSVYKDLKVESKTLPIDSLLTGDIVLWFKSDGNHMGIIGFDWNNSKMIFQSNGSANNRCAENYGSKRGPRCLPFSSRYWDSEDSWFFGETYSVLRIKAPEDTFDLRGKWVRQNDAGMPNSTGLIINYFGTSGIIEYVNPSCCFELGETKWVAYDKKGRIITDLAKDAESCANPSYKNAPISFSGRNKVTIWGPYGAIQYFRKP